MRAHRVFLALMAVAIGPRCGRGETVIITPTEIDTVLANPGMGWQSFHHVKTDDPNNEGIPSAAAYYRFYWYQIEPADGAIDFAGFDRLLAECRAAGQKLSFRVMCVGTGRRGNYSPAWLREIGCHGYTFDDNGTEVWCPDYEDPIFQDRISRLIRELGARYDGHPDLDSLDIGVVGKWGEWHMSGTKVPMPEPDTWRKIIDWHIEAFPTTPKVMLIGHVPGLAYAVSKGCGWRADCLGDMGGFSKRWNHMDNLYRQNVEKAAAGDAWQTAPVAFETCWDMRKWVDEGWDVRYIFDYALDLHASYVNNKSAPIPDGMRPEIERLLRRLGYRLVLRRLAYPGELAGGESLTLEMIWENVGVAPCYRDYVLGVRLLDGRGEPALTVATDRIVKEWLPGTHEVTVDIDLPADLAAGEYGVAIGVVDPATREPAVQLAIEGRNEAGWYPVGKLIIR